MNEKVLISTIFEKSSYFILVLGIGAGKFDILSRP
jgi:hypothetical protein